MRLAGFHGIKFTESAEPTVLLSGGADCLQNIINFVEAEYLLKATLKSG